MKLGKSQREKDPVQVASVAAMRDGLLLMGKRRDVGLWCCPGGHLNPGEKPEKGAIRELMEETGLKPTDLEKLGTVMVRDGSIEVHSFRVSVDGEPTAENDPDDEFEEFRWVDPDDMPDDILGNLYNDPDVTLDFLGAKLEKAVLDPAQGISFQVREFKEPGQTFRRHYIHEILGVPPQATGPTWFRPEFPAPHLIVTAHSPDGKVAGHGVFENDHATNLYPNSVFVQHAFQRQGIASAIYAHAEKVTGKKVVPSEDRTAAGKALWAGNAKQKQFGKTESVMKGEPENAPIPVQHYSDVPGLKVLDPKFQGSGSAGMERNRGSRIPRVYFYKRPGVPEAHIGAKPHLYHGTLPAGTKLYDMGTDSLGLLQGQWKQTPQGQMYHPADLDTAEKKLKRMGYHGYHNYGTRDAIAYFKPVPVEEQLSKAEDLEKKTPPTFPGLGVPDDRRETDIINTPRQLHIKERTMANAQASSPHNFTHDLPPNLGTPDERAQATAAQKVAAIRAWSRRGSKPRKDWVDQKTAEGILTTGPGLASTIPGTAMSYSHSNTSLKPSANPKPVRAPGTAGANRNGPAATQLHENLHLLFNRVEAQHGPGTRFALAQSLMNHIHNKTPRGYAALSTFFGRRYGLPADHPYFNEEHLTTLLNYLNNPGERQKYHSAYHEASNGEGLDGRKIREFDQAMKEAYAAFQDGAAKANPGWLAMPSWKAHEDSQAAEPVSKAELETLEKMAIKDVPLGTMISGKDVAHEPRQNVLSQPRFETGRREKWDYSHVLPEHHRKAGYSLEVHRNPADENWSDPDTVPLVAALNHGGSVVGHVEGMVQNTEHKPPRLALGVVESEIDPQHRNKGLGLPLYEALYAHAKHGLGATHVVGGEHSDSAYKLHQRLAEKHGLNYKPKPHTPSWSDGPGTTGPDWNGAWYGYNYRLKAEMSMNKSVDDLFDPPKPPFETEVQSWLAARGLKKAENNLQDDRLEAASEIAVDMLGFNPGVHPAFEAARFLAGSKVPEVSPADIRQALYDQDGDFTAAAIQAYQLPDNDESREAIQAIAGLEAVSKAESDQKPPQGKDIEPGTPDAESAALAVSRAFADKAVRVAHLDGKHSLGSLIAKDEETGVVFLLKPGSGGQSPARGAAEEQASQSRREACFWHVAEALGLGEAVPRCDLVIIDGREFAAIRMLPFSYKNLQRKLQRNPNMIRQALGPYRAGGVLTKWAVMDFILGNPDRHGQNMMISENDKVVALIDHGSAFAGRDFDPAHDGNSFVPFYLRAWAPQKFNVMTVPAKLARMPQVSDDVRRELDAWLAGIDPQRLEGLMLRYGIDPVPTLDRLAALRLQASDKPVDQAVNRLWVTT